MLDVPEIDIAEDLKSEAPSTPITPTKEIKPAPPIPSKV
jgi:hypothetical protein